MQLRKEISPRSRLHALIIRDTVLIDGEPKLVCCWCGRYITLATLTIEHVIPTAKGGSNLLDNLKLACRQCNSSSESWQPAGIQPKFDNVNQVYLVHPSSSCKKKLKRLIKRHPNVDELLLRELLAHYLTKQKYKI